MAKAKKQSLAESRGIYESRESNSSAVVLVAASIDATSKALADELKSERRECDIYGKKLKFSGSAYFPFQVRWHTWTTLGVWRCFAGWGEVIFALGNLAPDEKLCGSCWS